MKKTLLPVLLVIAAAAFGETALDSNRQAGPKPAQREDGSVEMVDRILRRGLRDPQSFSAEWKVLEGKTPGGAAAWAVDVVYRGTNAYGAFIQKHEQFIIKDGRLVTIKTLTQ